MDMVILLYNMQSYKKKKDGKRVTIQPCKTKVTTYVISREKHRQAYGQSVTQKTSKHMQSAIQDCCCGPLFHNTH